VERVCDELDAMILIPAWYDIEFFQTPIRPAGLARFESACSQIKSAGSGDGRSASVTSVRWLVTGPVIQCSIRLTV
jgi:hypothetical protein